METFNAFCGISEKFSWMEFLKSFKRGQKLFQLFLVIKIVKELIVNMIKRY